jgi:arginyl-tRNA synthetase
VKRRLTELGWTWDPQVALAQLDALTEENEKALLRQLDKYPEVVAAAASASEPHTVATYLRELAGDFHTCYNAHKVLVEDEALRNARVALTEAVRQVIANGLGLLGVSAPEEM